MPKPTPNETAQLAWATFRQGDLKKAMQLANKAMDDAEGLAHHTTQRLHEVIGAGVRAAAYAANKKK